MNNPVDLDALANRVRKMHASDHPLFESIRLLACECADLMDQAIRAKAKASDSMQEEKAA